ncbi:MAG: glycosyltransferase [Gemmatimonadetes bacterium]|nr:glycosyltransferase [Gemmatimonadota bacterium]
MSKKKILFHSQHLHGVGHHFRTLQIVRELSERHEIYWVEGGRRIPDSDIPEPVKIIQQEPIYFSNWGRLISANRKISLKEALNSRKRVLKEVIETIKPDIFFIEYFPFRWTLANELMQALSIVKTLNSSCKVVCSLRDVPRESPATSHLSNRVPPDPLAKWYKKKFYTKNPLLTPQERERRKARLYYEQVVSTLNSNFECLLVHTDPRVNTLDQYFPWIEKLQIEILYTGYVAQRISEKSIDYTHPFVLVSSGGGADAYKIVKPCIDAWKLLYRHNKINNRQMIIFTGLFIPQSKYKKLQRGCENGPFKIEMFTNDFIHWMKAADFSISRAGYNTCMNILETKTPALVVPSGLTNDQYLRGQTLSNLGLVEMIMAKDLRPHRIAESIERGVLSSHSVHDISMDGAKRTADILSVI